MIYGILGDLVVRDPAGAIVQLPTGRARAVLAALLLRANRQQSAADLLTAGWGDPAISPAQLHKAVAAVRRMLEAAGRPDALKTQSRFGYGLKVDESDLDALLFKSLVKQADERRDGSAREVALLRRALALWRSGRPLADMHLASLSDEIEALRRQRRRVATRLFTLEAGPGAQAELAEELAAFAAEYPDDAKLCRLLMVALFQEGHVDDAVAAFERYRAASLSPEQSLRDLAYAISLRDDAAVAALVNTAAVASPLPLPLPRQLPAPPPYFVGREQLLAEVVWLLREPRLPVLTICGPPGMGKTALALRAGHDAAELYPDGQLWADLRGTQEQPADPAEVLAEFLRALGVPSVPEARHERAALYRSTVAGRRVLVVLDDAAGGAQVRDLLPGGGDSVVLITARRRLPDIGAPAHQVAPLSAFDEATAGELFRRILADGHIDASGDQEAIAEVVRLCGGLPLAVRMAALLRVDAPHRSTRELSRRLAEQGPTAFAYGEESLARTLGAGLAPLDERARRLFLGLGLLDLPTFAEWTAAAVLDENGPAAGEALAQLAAVGMLEPASDQGSFRFHDLTRQYARGLAAVAPSWAQGVDGAALRVCRALLSLTRHAHNALYGEDFDVAHSDAEDFALPAATRAAVADSPRAWFERERFNIRAAVGQAAGLGRADLCWDLAVSAHEFYAIGGYFDDWRATHEIALAACRAAGDRRGEGLVLTMLGQPPLVASGSSGVSGVPELETAVRLLGEVGEDHGRAVAQRTLANAMRRNGELRRPLVQFTEALAHYEQSGDVIGCQQTLRHIGHTHLDRGDAESAVAVLREAEKLARRLGQGRVLGPTLYWMGQAHLARGDVAAAAAAFGEVQDMFAPDSGVAHAYALHGLGDLALARGDVDLARTLIERARTLARDGADTGLEGRVGLSLAALEASLGRHRQEVNVLWRALAPIRRGLAIRLEIRVEAGLALAYERIGDPAALAQARQRLNELYERGNLPPEDRLFG